MPSIQAAGIVQRCEEATLVGLFVRQFMCRCAIVAVKCNDYNKTMMMQKIHKQLCLVLYIIVSPRHYRETQVTGSECNFENV